MRRLCKTKSGMAIDERRLACTNIQIGWRLLPIAVGLMAWFLLIIAVE
jgi:hypothetical protein